LFLMTWLSANEVDAGQNFSNCLSSQGDTTSYSQLLTYFNGNTISSGQWLNLCCNHNSTWSCSSLKPAQNCLSGYPGNLGHFSCVKIDQAVYCDTNTNVTIDACGGIIGDNKITRTTTLGTLNLGSPIITDLDNCKPNIKSVEDGLNSSSISKDYACQSSVAGWFNCCWDNDGWTCHGYLNSDLYGSNNNNANCYIQWPGPTSSSASESSSSSNLPLHIGVPIGGAVLVVGVSGVVYWKSRSKWVGNKSNEEVIEDVKKNPKEWDYKQVADAEENMSPWLIRSKSIEQKGTYIDVESGNGKWAFKKEGFSEEEWRKIEQALKIEEDSLKSSIEQPLQH